MFYFHQAILHFKKSFAFIHLVLLYFEENLFLYYRYKYEIDGSAGTISDSQINNETGNQIIEQINRILLTNLWPDNDHLLAAEVS